MLVPAFAGSAPRRANKKGRAVPVKTEDTTMRNSEDDIAKELTMLPFVMYTRKKPPTAWHKEMAENLQWAS